MILGFFVFFVVCVALLGGRQEECQRANIDVD